MRVITLPVLSNNYSYLIIDKHGTAVVVDPADPEKVLWAAQQQRARLKSVLTTHGHSDHAGGNKKLAQHLPELEIVGGAGDAVPACTRPISKHLEVLEVGDLEITCLATPYHTAGHICYLISEKDRHGPQALFSGDVLFVGGCGRRFQGSPEQMHHTLMGVLAVLPPETLVYCGHEYTVANLEFAATIEESNAAIQEKLQWAREQRALGRATVPSTIGAELEHNVFLRCYHPSVQHHVGTAVPINYAGKTGQDACSEEVMAEAADCSPRGCADPLPHEGNVCANNEVCIQTMAELRRRKDNFGLMARVLTMFLAAGSWFGWTP